eukprot:1541136-Pleurochrysis_carterae.AAC.1
MAGSRIGLEFTAHVAHFCVAQYAACGSDGKGEISYSRVERKLYINQGGKAVAQAANSICHFLGQDRIGKLSGDGKRAVEPLNRVDKSVQSRHRWLRDTSELEGMDHGRDCGAGGRRCCVRFGGENA